MHLKRYRSGTVKEALAQARAELGPNALVLSTKLVPADGVRGLMGIREVEVTAGTGAADDDVMSESRPAARGADIASLAGRLGQARAAAPRVPVPPPVEPPEAPASRPAPARAAAAAIAAAVTAATAPAAVPPARVRGSRRAAKKAAARQAAVTETRPDVSASPRRAVAADSFRAAAVTRPVPQPAVAAGALASPSWAGPDDDDDEPRPRVLSSGSRTGGDVPWEYRDEPLTGAMRWLVDETATRRRVGADDPHVQAIVSRLCATGLHREIAEGIALAVPKEHRRNGSSALLEQSAAIELASLVTGDEPYAPVELFVGPPGAGKTTTIAKIAAQERARRGARLSLLAADGFRVGAVEQLRIYADIIGTPFAAARTQEEIEQALLATKSTVLVDTAGRSVRDPRAQEVLSWLAGIPGVRTHLVLPATTTVRDFNRLLDAYGRRRPSRVVLTRVDEADSVSPLMQVFKERGMKVSFLGVGQRVPEDLERATPQRLAAHVLGHGLPEGLPA